MTVHHQVPKYLTIQNVAIELSSKLLTGPHLETAAAVSIPHIVVKWEALSRVVFLNLFLKVLNYFEISVLLRLLETVRRDHERKLNANAF